MIARRWKLHSFSYSTEMLEARRWTEMLEARRLSAISAVSREPVEADVQGYAGKRPKDPSIKLSHLRARELEAQMEAGKFRAESSKLGAGFLGGSSNAAVGMWLTLAAVALGFFVFQCYTVSRLLSQSLLPTPFDWTYLFSLVPIVSLGSYRGYYLSRKMYREAYHSFIFSLVCICLTQLINLIFRLVYFQFRTYSRPFLCANLQEPSSCRGWRFVAGLQLAVVCCVLCSFACMLGLFAALSLAEGRIIVASNTVKYIAAIVGVAILGYGIGQYLVTNELGASLSFLIVVVCALLFGYMSWKRNQVKKNADPKIAKDKDKYDNVWTEIVGEYEEKSHTISILGELQSILGDFTSERKKMNLTARQSKKILLGGEEILKSKPCQAIKDLVVLFAQADELNPHFQQCSEKWCSSPGSTHKFSAVKRKARAIEKLYRSYNGDASRLTDLVRSSISCETFEDLKNVLNKILSDPTVVILHVKNKFKYDYKSAESAGYRNINLLLILVDDATMEAGVDCHICELQLGLSKIDEIKNVVVEGEQHGHQRYVEWRDLLAE